MKLFKALIILLLTLLQWAIVYINLNRWKSFQAFVDIEWYEEKQHSMPIEDPYEPNLFT